MKDKECALAAVCEERLGKKGASQGRLEFLYVGIGIFVSCLYDLSKPGNYRSCSLDEYEKS